MNTQLFGIPNIGNTCYINSIIQILWHTDKLNNILKNTNNLKNNMESMIVKHWTDLYTQTLESQPFSSHNLIHSIRKYITQLDNTHQQDASEFLINLIDIFKIALSHPVKITISDAYNNQNNNSVYIECYKRIKQLYSNDYSELVNIFNGMLITEIKDVNNKKISITFDPYSILQLPTPNIPTSTIYDCLDLLLTTETLTDYTVSTDSIITNVLVHKTYYLWLTPKILILNLKKYNKNTKFNTYIDIPHNLNLSRYLYEGCPENPIYELYAICNHMGNMNNGHYYSYILISHINKWVIFNDNSKPVEIDSRNVITPNAICAFYRKL